MIDRKLGTLEPIIYFENSRGEIVLPPETRTARYFYSERKDARGLTYRDHGFEWREAGSLAEVDALQKRLVEVERKKGELEWARDEARFRALTQGVRDSLYAKMVSSSTSEFDREAIKYYLQLREEKRAVHRQRLEERNFYLHAREMDSHSLATDRIKE